MTLNRLSLCLAVVTCTVSLGSAIAGLPSRGSDWDVESQVDTRLITMQTAIGPKDAILWAGWQANLKERWKTYWRTPGDAGQSPVWDWSESSNIAAVDVQWPTPERLTVFGLHSYVYSKEVVLPLKIRLKQPGQPADLRLKLEFMVCEEICVPLLGEYRLKVAAGNPMLTAEASLLRTYMTRVPTSKSPIQIASVEYAGCDDLKVALTEPLAKDFAIDAFVAGPDGMAFGPPILNADRRVLKLPVKGADEEKAKAPLNVVLSRTDGEAVSWDGIAANFSQKSCMKAGT